MKTKLLFLFAALFAIIPEIVAQGTVFTYQGRLSDNGGPANGQYDLRFTLYNAFEARGAGRQASRNRTGGGF